MGTVREMTLNTPAGLYLGRAATYTPDPHRICGVVERVTRGLFFHHFGTPVDSRSVRVLSEDFTDWNALGQQAVVKRIVTWLANKPPQRIGEAFEYSYEVVSGADERQIAAAWLMKFYRRVVFLSLTGPGGPAVTVRGVK